MKIVFCLALLSAWILVMADVTKEAERDAMMAQQIHNATFMERTPEFTDLYIIQTPDKGRQITIYCNSSHCYKRHGATATV